MDHNSSSTKVFDFSTQASIMSLLAGIRKSELPTVVKNELRDLVFLYTSGGGDESTRIALEQKLINHKIEPVTSTNKKQTEKVEERSVVRPTLSFGAYRPTPSFTVPTMVVKADTARPTVSVATAKTAVKQFRSQTEKKVDENNLVQEIPNNLPQASDFKKEEIKEDVVNKISTAKSVVSEVVVEDEGREKKTESKQVDPTVNKKYLDRIREIKNIVNSKVGNPVNLVDIDNQVGREYMNALLEAMKKLSSTSTTELEVAMQRLETAFLAVDRVVNERSISEKVVEVAKDEVTTKTETAAAGTPSKEVSEAVKVETVTKETKVAPEVKPVVMASPVVEVNRFTPKSEEKSGFENTDVAPVMSNIPVKPIPPMRVMANPVVPSQPKPAPVPAPVVPTKITSLAEEKKVPSFSDLPTSLPRKESEVGNPLFTDEIDAGLDELLSDWSLFKKSGLFGTGPKGREHPLFQKMSSIQIPLILAGRFDGATQEIRQSITDYMNGWRYEQGIVYEPGETFETYLRRVIKHIIDLQKQRNSA